MRIGLAIGRPDPLFDPTAGRDLDNPNRETAFWTSALLADLQRASAGRGWQSEVLYIGEGLSQRAARPDVVFNMISEPLICQGALALLDQLDRRFDFKILNGAEATRRTSRINLPALAPTLEKTLIPLTTWHRGPASQLPAHIGAAGHRWPVLLRPPGSHGSAGLMKVESPASGLLRVADAPGGHLVTDFHDFKSADGLYRKHRLVRVGDRLFRRHLIITDDWNVTGARRAYMVDKPHLIGEEKAFLAGTDEDLEHRIAALFAAAGLDFGLIDFALTGDGTIVVFELNGCFQITGSIPADKIARWGHLEATNAPILDAMLDLAARSAKAA